MNQIFKNLEIVKKIKNKFSKDEKISLSGFSDAEKAIVIANFEGKKIVLAPDFISASKIETMLSSLGIKVEVVKENVLNQLTQKEIEKRKELTKKITNFLFGKTDVLIFLPHTINIFADENIFKSFSILKNKNYSREDIIKNLTSLGFARVQDSPAENEFCFLGDILRIKTEQNCVVDFFDEQVESIKVDGANVDDLTLCAKDFENKNLTNIFLNLVCNNLLFVCEPKRILDELFYLEIEEKNRDKNAVLFLNKNNLFEKINEKTNKYLIFNEIFDILSSNSINNQNVGVRKYFYDYKSLISDLEYYIKNNFKVFLFCGSDESQKSIFNMLLQNKIAVKILNEADAPGVYVSNLEIFESASFLEEKVVFIGSDDLIKKSRTAEKYITKKNIYLPKVGDFVVHEFHGIGKCVAIERLKLLNYEKDYVVVEYKGGDKLYVPTEQLNLLSSYVGVDENPKLSTIGGLEFARQKEKVKESVKKMTFDLIQLYNERNKKKGFVYEPNNYLFKAFEDAFPYELTEDQKKACDEIYKDMESNKILDRLVCGDVGYGKTEVALRAAFKAVLSGKQVAFICPTTVLSEQHFKTCEERFKNFMVKVEVLNRFKTKKTETDELLKNLAEGKIDIIVGTHRLLSKDVKFKDLGLLILDEEQKFGVEHKETIKKMKSSVDVLTLSATPIPRTLQMSLMGVRDISLIETPPQNRLPVQTYVTEYSNELLVDACKKELARNGQVFIIYNEIKTIEEFAARVRALLPEARVGIAHAQMPEKELKVTIDKLYNYGYDIIIATTLLENGIDNPLANTLIVIDADKLGLSELYQLKGRVGRSDRLAYTYFTFEPQKVLAENAYKRLEAISSLTELGSGFKVALRDLEIRGAGNVLGREQHGHLTKIGFDLYNKIVAECASEFMGVKNKELKEIKMEIALDAFIPKEYIKEEAERIEIYSKISQLTSKQQAEKLKEELEKTFGQIPAQINSLIKIGLLKNLAQENYVSKVVLNSAVAKFVLYKQENFVTDKISASLKTYKDIASLKIEKEIYIEFKLGKTNETLNNMIDFLS
ncbi:MAG: transcription-repair coupling factor [Clostridia bacterium]|nr:transcription-repair coupling factor [Clostridia bacterium]